MSYSLLKHQQELVDKLGKPEIPARLIGDEMLAGDRQDLRVHCYRGPTKTYSSRN